MNDLGASNFILGMEIKEIGKMGTTRRTPSYGGFYKTSPKKFFP
jgi:hypothetical protein